MPEPYILHPAGQEFSRDAGLFQDFPQGLEHGLHGRRMGPFSRIHLIGPQIACIDLLDLLSICIGYITDGPVQDLEARGFLLQFFEAI